MSIREATDDDIEEIIELLKEGHLKSPSYGEQGYVEVRAAAFLDRVLSNPKAVILVDENLDGVLAAEIIPNWKGLGWMAATHVLYSRKGKAGLKLIQAYRKWANEWPQVTRVTISTSYGDDERTDELFNRLGFKPIGRTYLEVSQ